MQRAHGLEIPETLEEVCRPQRLALLVYDMQVGIVRHLPNAEAFVAQVVRVVEAARRAGVRVVFARHLSLPNELTGVFQLRTAMAWQRVQRVEDVKPQFLRDSPDFQLVPQLTPLPSEAVFDKLGMSMFVGTPLEMVLRDCGVNAFAIVGAVTEIGIEPTVRHGADLGVHPGHRRRCLRLGRRGGRRACPGQPRLRHDVAANRCRHAHPPAAAGPVATRTPIASGAAGAGRMAVLCKPRSPR